MNTTPGIRKIWREGWLSCLHDFMDRDLQKRTWLDPKNKNPHWSYIEFMCSYFDGTLHGADYCWAIAEDLVTPEEATIVAPLHRLLEAYEAPGKNNYDNEAILNDPAWIGITDTAKRVVSLLATTLMLESERDVLSGKV